VTWRYAATAWLHTVGLVDVGKLLLPRLFGQSIWQINLASMIAITSSFGVGAVAAAGYAMQVMLLPHGLVGLSVGTVIFPRLARLAASGEQAQFGVEASHALQSVLAVALPGQCRAMVCARISRTGALPTWII
jgi:putative peptidoglycan lipid II flippase